MREQTKEDNNEDDDGVVHGEVGEIGADPGVGVSEAGRKAESVPVHHLLPWAARLQSFLQDLFLAGDEFEVGSSGRG